MRNLLVGLWCAFMLIWIPGLRIMASYGLDAATGYTTVALGIGVFLAVRPALEAACHQRPRVRDPLAWAINLGIASDSFLGCFPSNGHTRFLSVAVGGLVLIPGFLFRLYDASHPPSLGK